MSSRPSPLVELLRDGFAPIRIWQPTKGLALLCVLVGFLMVWALVDVPSLATLREWADSFGPQFIWIFLALYIAITQFPIPRTLLTLASGVLFGPVWGIAVALLATTVSAALSLSIVRLLIGEWLRPRLTHPAVERINLRLEQRGWLAVTSLRMIAGVPFSLLNYLAALSAVPLGAFTLATLIGSAPGTIITVLLGDALTGPFDPLLVGLTVGIASLGIVGLIIDQRLPVKSAE